ncbi:MAG: IS1634 family transposase [Actinomycetales bacterium]|nr:IS1634 family transposase [Actinomycetales bacterium]
MFVKTSTRRNRNGTTTRYLQLAHNEWDPVAKTSRTKVVYSFGRAEEVDRAAIERLITALMRVLGTQPAAEEGPARVEASGVPGLEYLASRPVGGAWVLEGIWHQLGIDALLRKLAAKTRRDPIVERVLFALVANRALAPSSKLAATSWVAHDVHVCGLETVTDDACYRAMDWLLAVEDKVARGVYDAVADLLNLHVDLIFFDTTSTYFETAEEDEPLWRDAAGRVVEGDPDADRPDKAVDQGGFRTWGKSKDSRDDLPQVIVGMAVTREGIPVRVWSWPGNTGDSPLIRQVKNDMRHWSLGKVIWVADRGFTSAANRKHLASGGSGYILGEKLRSGSPEATAALSRQGRYTDIDQNLRVKEVKVSATERFVICHNPEAALRDEAIRTRMLTRLEEAIRGSDDLPPDQRAELRGVISTKPGMSRYLRVTPGGLLRVDKKKIAVEANLDGKYLLRTSDPTLTSTDIALGYKQLLEVERGWRDMKSVLDLRPVYHRLEDRIRAHVLLCWLALLLARIVETRTGATWTTSRAELQRLHVGTFTGPAGTFRQTTTPTPATRRLHEALGLKLPPRIWHLDPEPAPSPTPR